MKIEEQVLSIEQMKHLQELGVDTSDASMAYYNISRDNQPDKWVLGIANKKVASIMISNGTTEMKPTYTIGDLIEKLPKHINGWNDNRLVIDGDEDADCWYVVYKNRYEHSETEYFDSENLLTALYNLLCWVAETHKELLVKK